MLGFDGTGPMGMGPMTGGRRGFCSVPGVARRPRLGRGGWWGGYGWQRGGPWYRGQPTASPLTRNDELDFLKNEAEAMRAELQQVETRISGLGKSAEQT